MNSLLNREALLAYCVFHIAGLRAPDPLPLGVDGRPVTIVVHNGLGVAASRVAGAPMDTSIATVLTFQNVIESFHRGQTVIPLRYSSCFGEEHQLPRFLEKSAERFEALLNELEGCSEMAIRILLPSSGESGRAGVSAATSPGLAYLAERRAALLREEESLIEQELTISKIRGSLDGLFLRGRTECRVLPKARFVSLYFLVSGESLQSFVRVFEESISKMNTKLLLTGPWAPYNFVVSENPSGYDAPAAAASKTLSASGGVQ